jgi:UTP-glucose-1-phosphate uridylyltransferase
MAKDLTLVILAGGLASRYGGIKQMDAVGPADEAILDYSVYDAIQAGFNKVVFILNKIIIQDFTEKYKDRFSNKIKAEFVIQDIDDIPVGFSAPEGRQKPWGTGHAVRAARNYVNEPFAAINADDFYGREAFSTIAEYLTQNSPNYAMYAYKLKNTLSEYGTVSRGVCKVNSTNELISINENTAIQRVNSDKIASTQNPDLSADTLVSMNLWAFLPDIFPIIEKTFDLFMQSNSQSLTSEFYIPTFIQHIIDKKIKPIDIISGNSQWFGMTYKSDREETKRSILKLIDMRVYPLRLW